MAILGYLMYGDDVKSQVTLNLPEGKIGSKLAIYTTLINPFSKYALMVTPLATAVEERLLLTAGSGSGRGSSKRSINVLVRTLLVVSTVVVALAVPFFGHLMALVGSLLSVMAAMLLPSSPASSTSRSSAWRAAAGRRSRSSPPLLFWVPWLLRLARTLL